MKTTNGGIMGDNNLKNVVNRRFNTEEIKENFAILNFLVAIINKIKDLYLLNLTDEQFKKLAQDEMVKIPIMDEEIISNLRLVKPNDWASIYLALSELGSSLEIAIDIISNNTEESPDTMQYQTPFIITIQVFDPDLLLDDGDDDRDDDDDPVGEKEKPVTTMAMSAGAGRK